VAVSVTVNPVTASLVGAAFLGEALHWTTLVGLAGVLAGISIATSRATKKRIRSADGAFPVDRAPEGTKSPPRLS
jgi:drug/metabolite transporter (DMT)-like permease